MNKLEEGSKMIKDKEGNILCEKHNLFVNSICIQKNCNNVLNCIDCSIIDMHCHSKNISINSFFNKKIDNKLYNEQLYDQEKFLILVKSNIEEFRKDINIQIDFFEKKTIEGIKNKSKEKIIIGNKKEFQKSREEYLKNNDSFELLKKLAENFYKFSEVRNSKSYEYSDKILEILKNDLKNIKKKNKNLLINCDLKTKINIDYFDDSEIKNKKENGYNLQQNNSFNKKKNCLFYNNRKKSNNGNLFLNNNFNERNLFGKINNKSKVTFATIDSLNNNFNDKNTFNKLFMNKEKN